MQELVPGLAVRCPDLAVAVFSGDYDQGETAIGE